MAYPFSQAKSMAGDNHRRVWWASLDVDAMQHGGLFRSDASRSSFGDQFCGYASMADERHRVPWATKSF
jgi:hypothetical protein